MKLKDVAPGVPFSIGTLDRFSKCFKLQDCLFVETLQGEYSCQDACLVVVLSPAELLFFPQDTEVVLL